MTASERKKLTATIRAAIKGSGLSRYEIAKRAGIEESTLSRFMNAKASLSLDTIELLAPVLGLRIVANGKKR